MRSEYTNYQADDHTAATQPSRAYPPRPEFTPIPLKPTRKLPGLGFWIALLFVGLVVYFIFPSSSTVLVLGIDRAPEGTAAGRSDTNILLKLDTLPGDVTALSIPRDLWVLIPGYGENRINAAHYFGEVYDPGSGPQVAKATVIANFGVPVDYYLRIQLEKFAQVVDAVGGVEVTLDEPISGYAAGTYQMDGTEALAFVRSRAGSDDFFRMQQGQIFIRALTQKLFQPATWPRLPAFVVAVLQVVDTDIPAAKIPRLLVAGLRAGITGIDFVALERDMVTPWVTNEGAQVLLPNWSVINAAVGKAFGE